MAGRNLARTAAAGVLVVTLLAAAIQVEAFRERSYPLSAVDETIAVTSSSAVRRLAGAFDALAADFYWIRTIQYYGGVKRQLTDRPAGPTPPPLLATIESREYDQLYTLLDITTTLDPRFDIAYRFGAVFLAEADPAGAGRSDLAVKLLEKGVAVRPDKWEYMYDIGFVHYWYAHDYRQASSWFEAASRVPGAPVWLEGLAAAMLAQGGDRQASRAMWEAIRQSSQVDWMRTTAELRLLQFRALDAIDEIQAALDRLTRSRGAVVSDWLTATGAGALPGIPLDPAGTPFELTPDGRVQLAPSSALFPLPAEPQRNNPPQ